MAEEEKKETPQEAKREMREAQKESRMVRLLEPKIWVYFLFLLAFSAVSAWR
mgnify:CR=1 FL=1